MSGLFSFVNRVMYEREHYSSAALRNAPHLQVELRTLEIVGDRTVEYAPERKLKTCARSTARSIWLSAV